MAQRDYWSDDNNRISTFGTLYNYRHEFNIDNERDLAKFAHLVNTGSNFNGKTVRLKTNLQMRSHYWVPIGTEAHPFRGTFLGNGHTISGLNIKENEEKSGGLFGCVENANISGFVLKDCSIAGNEHAGGVAGQAVGGTIKNCRVESSVILKGVQTGGIVGMLTKEAVVDGCVSSAKVGAGTASVVGSIDAKSKLNNCLSVGDRLVINDSKPVYSVVNQISGGTLNYGTSSATYSVAKLVVYEKGMSYSGNFMASKGEAVTFTVEGITLTPRTKIMADGEVLTASDGKYSLTLDEQNVNITLEEPVLEWTSGTTLCRLQGTTFTVTPTGETGAMADYYVNSDLPAWSIYSNEIQTIIVEEGVTAIGNRAFYGCQHIGSVTIPVTVKRIGNNAFSDCIIQDVYCYPSAFSLQTGIQDWASHKPRWHVYAGQLQGYKAKVETINAEFIADLKDATFDADGNNDVWWEAVNGSVCDIKLKGLTLVREGFTLCLPFNVSDLSSSPLAGAEIHELVSASTVGSDVRLFIGPTVNKIEPGKMYYGRWNAAGGDLQDPVFHNVFVMAGQPFKKESDKCTLQGFYNVCDIADQNVTDVHGTKFPTTKGVPHSGFKAYLLSPQSFETINFIQGDHLLHIKYTNKPEWWPEVSVYDNTNQTLMGNDHLLINNHKVHLEAKVGVGYDLEWYVNGVKQENKQNMLEFNITQNTEVEARYIEHKKLTYKGSPLVRYADSKGVVTITQNYYNYSYMMEKAFGYTVQSWTGSNSKNYLVDNLLADNMVTTETLTADIEMTPTQVLNEEDMGDNTVTVTWRFDMPDSFVVFRHHHGEGARFPYVMPTQFSSYFIDVAMTIDATNGLISNDLRKADGNTFVGCGTKFTIPAKYGATYKLKTSKKLNNVNIGGSKDFSYTTVGKEHLATMEFYRTDLDSVVVEFDEDVELIYFEATYPGGDNSMMIRPAVNKAESSISTVSKTGESGCLLYKLSDIENHGNLKITPSAYATGTSLIEMPEAYDENRYMSVSFEVKEGYSFKPKTTNLYTMPVNTGNNANFRIMLIDERGNKCDTIFRNVPQNVMKLDTIKPKAPSKELELCLYGKIELRIYGYGVAGNYRLGDSIKIDGELCQTIQFPEGQDIIPHLITSAIDFDGVGLIHIDAYEVVDAREDTRTVVRTAMEETHMGTVVLVHSDTPGALYNIPLTRPDDSYVSGQSILKVSDGSVIGTKSHYVFARRDSICGFYMAAIGEPIAEGEVYFTHDSENILTYYIYENDVPPTVDEVVLFADADNSTIIHNNMGRVINQVSLGGRHFYKDGRWNVFCLPFNLSGKDIRNSPLKNGSICEFIPEESSYDTATGALDLTFENAYEIEAGKPYIVRWNKGEDIANPIFNNVTFVNTTPSNVTSDDGHVTFHPSYGTAELKNDGHQIVTIRNSMSADNCMHAMKAYFTLPASDKGIASLHFDISVDNQEENKMLENEDYDFSVYYNKVIDYDVATLTNYKGEGGILEVPDSISFSMDKSNITLAVNSIGPNVFSHVGDQIEVIDMSRCSELAPFATDRTIPGTPFFGLNESALVYLPDVTTQPADNVVIDGMCSKLVLNDQFGFTPLYDFHANEVVLNRSTTATNGWQSFCLPFNLTNDMISVLGGELMEFAGAKKENGTLTLFCNKTNLVDAGNPAFVRWENGGSSQLAFSNVDIVTTSPAATDFNGVAYYGTYVSVPLTEADQAKLFVIDSRTDNYNMSGFQAYFLMDEDIYDNLNSVCLNDGIESDYEAIEPLTGHYDVAYTIWCYDNNTLYFAVPDHKLKVGDTYDGHVITALWKGDDVVNKNVSPIWHNYDYLVEQVVFDESFRSIRPTTCSQWFQNFRRMKNIEGLHFLQTSEVTSMAYMFENCTSLTGSLYLGDFDTSNVTDMRNMFSNCSQLESINLLGFNTEQVTDMSEMFSDCSALYSLDLSGFDTRSVKTMSKMFRRCTELAELDLTSFNTSNVSDMSGMFISCHSLTELDLTSFNTANVEKMSIMFSSDLALTTITVGEGWTDAKLKEDDYMFFYATSLVGQNGTTYNNEMNNSPKTYAHIDGGADNPGLLWGIVDVTLTDLTDNSETLERFGGHKVNVTYDREFSAIDNGDGTWTSRAFTTCLPYSKDLSELFDTKSVRLYQLSLVNDSHEFVFTQVPPDINAGSPYLVVVDKGTVNLNADNVKMLAHPNEHVEENMVFSSLETWGKTDDLMGWWRGTFRVIDNEESSEMHLFGLSMKDGKWKTILNDTESHRKAYVPQFRAYYLPLEYPGDEEYNTVFKFIEAGSEGDAPYFEQLPDEFVYDVPDNEELTGIKPTIHTIDADGTHRYFDLLGRPLNSKPLKGIYIDNGVKRISK